MARRQTQPEITPDQKIDEALKELDLVSGSFLHGKVGIAFTVNTKRIHLTYALLKISNVASVKRAIEHQLRGG